MRTRTYTLSTALALVLLVPSWVAVDGGAGSEDLSIGGLDVAPGAWCPIRDAWLDGMLADTPPGSWAPLRLEATDAALQALGLPSREFLLGHHFHEPTLVLPDGSEHAIDLETLELAVKAGGGGNGGGKPTRTTTPTTSSITPSPTSSTLATFAGTGCLGIRPGALLLSVTGNSIGICSMAHVYGAPGSYEISTAGHCGKVGDTGTVIAALGNRGGLAGPILLDFGKFTKSVDNGPGQDWALIGIESRYQGLVTPTMCFWGGPRGMYTSQGSVVGVNFPRNSLIPTATLTPNPDLAQDIVHYGHGLGLGTGGTPRSGVAQHWGPTFYTFFGAITPGDSGSGANTLTGDDVGDTMEAAGIMTHIWVDPLMRNGVGIMLGTRATQVQGTLADGQLVGYPAPLPMLP